MVCDRLPGFNNGRPGARVLYEAKLRLLCIGFGVMGIAGCATVDHRVDQQAIHDVLQAQAQAWNRGDMTSFMDGYERSPDIIFTSSAVIRRGFAETLTRYQQAYSDKGHMGNLSFDVLDTRFIGRDAAVVLGRYTLRDTPKSGTGLFTLVFVRTADGWRCIHDHTSAATTTSTQEKGAGPGAE